MRDRRGSDQKGKRGEKEIEGVRGRETTQDVSYKRIIYVQYKEKMKNKIR